MGTECKTESETIGEYEQGKISSFQIDKGMQGGWLLRLVTETGDFYLSTAREQSHPRAFKTIDAVISAIEKITRKQIGALTASIKS